MPAPTRDTEFSTRIAHQFGEHHSAYAEYSYEDWTGQNQGVGGQTLAAAGFNNRYHEDDLKIHVDSTLSTVLLNQVSVVAEHDFSHNVNAAEAPRVNVQGNFTSGSAQNDALSTEYNLRIYDMMTWTHGRHFVKFGAGTPHINRRAFNDNTKAHGWGAMDPAIWAEQIEQYASLGQFSKRVPALADVAAFEVLEATAGARPHIG